MARSRVAILCNGTSLEGWHLRCLERLEQVADLVAVLVAPGRPATLHGSRALRLYAQRVESRLAVNPGQRLARIPHLRATDAGTADAGPAFDLVLRLGRVAIPTSLVDAATRGVWFFEHESDDEPPFLRAAFAGEDVSRAALTALDARRVETTIAAGWFRIDRRSYAASRARILDCVAAWPARACQGREPGADTDAVVPTRDETQTPAARRRLRLLPYAAAATRARLATARDRLFRHPQWNVGILDVPAGALLAPGAYADSRVEWFPLGGRASFLADPFGVERDGRIAIVCERFDYRESKGRLCAFEYTADGFSNPVDAALPHFGHVSYPFLLEQTGEIYCVPETADAHEIALFRATEFPSRWEKVGVLVDDFPGVDPTVFRHDGRWWLACSRQGPEEDAELWIFHAGDLSGPWEHHAHNPVKTDVRGARPAGPPFLHEGELYRPAQDCSSAYGGRIAVQRVVRLSPTAFHEEPVAVLEASAGSRFPHGPHTLTPVGDRVLVDGRRAVFVPSAFGAFLGIWGKDVAGKLRPRR